jgi:hypothetical protein
MALLDVVPLGQARAAARRRRMLGDEHRVPPPRRLPPVIAWLSRGESFADELCCVFQNDIQAVTLQTGRVLGTKPEAAAEPGAGQGGEEFVEVAHRLPAGSHRLTLIFRPGSSSSGAAQSTRSHTSRPS